MEEFSYWCALASRLVYLPVNEIEQRIHGMGLQFINASLLHGSYRGVCFVKTDLNLIIIAHRGTNPDNLHHLLADGTLAKGDIPKEAELARVYSDEVRKLMATSKYRDYHIIETGHSLGGFIAQCNTVFFNDKSITFESPGIKKALDKNNTHITEELSSKMLTYLAAPNPINTCNGHVGRVIRLYIEHIAENSISFQTRDVLTILETIPDLFPVLFDPARLPLILSEKIFNAILEFLGRIPQGLANYYLNQHSIDSILRCFSPDEQLPLLQKEVCTWPSLLDYLAWFSHTGFWGGCFAHISNLGADNLIKANIKIESMIDNIPGYSVGLPIIPTTDPQDFYVHRVLQQFSVFYTDEKNKEFLWLVRNFQYQGPVPQLTRGETIVNKEIFEQLEQREKKARLGGATIGAGSGGGLIGLAVSYAAAPITIASAGIVIPSGAIIITGVLVGGIAGSVLGYYTADYGLKMAREWYAAPLQERLIATEARNIRLLQERDDVLAELNKTQAALAEATAAIAQLRGELEAERGAREQAMRDHKAAVEAHQRTIDAHEIEMLDLKDEMKKKQTEIITLVRGEIAEQLQNFQKSKLEKERYEQSRSVYAEHAQQRIEYSEQYGSSSSNAISFDWGGRAQSNFSSQEKPEQTNAPKVSLI